MIVWAPHDVTPWWVVLLFGVAGVAVGLPTARQLATGGYRTDFDEPGPRTPRWTWLPPGLGLLWGWLSWQLGDLGGWAALPAYLLFAWIAVVLLGIDADVHRLPFIRTVLPEAVRQEMGVIAMKVCAQGRLLRDGFMPMDDALGYVWSLAGVSLAIVGCQTPAEVDDNARIARAFAPLPEMRMRELEEQTRRQATLLSYFKKDA